MSAQKQVATLSLNSTSAAQQMSMISSRGLQKVLVETSPSSLLSVQAHDCNQEPPAGRLLWVSFAQVHVLYVAAVHFRQTQQLCCRCKCST